VHLLVFAGGHSNSDPRASVGDGRPTQARLIKTSVFELGDYSLASFPISSAKTMSNLSGNTANSRVYIFQVAV